MFEKCIYFNSNALVRHLNRTWEAAYSSTGLSASHAYLLRMVCHEPGLNQKQISLELNLEKSTLTRFVDKLIEKKLMLRRSTENGRENRLYPTEKGKQLGLLLDSIGTQLYQTMRKQLGPEQFDQLVQQIRVTMLALK